MVIAICVKDLVSCHLCFNKFENAVGLYHLIDIVFHWNTATDCKNLTSYFKPLFSVEGPKGVVMKEQLILGWLKRMRPVIQRRRRADMQRHFRTSDVLQEAAIQLLSEFDEQGDSEREISQAWLSCVARGHVSRLEAWHQRKKRSASSTKPLTHECVTDGPSPAESAERKDLWAKAAVALAVLPREQREIIHRHDVNGESFRTIGEALGRPHHQVKRLYHKAIKDVRSILKQA